MLLYIGLNIDGWVFLQVGGHPHGDADGRNAGLSCRCLATHVPRCARTDRNHEAAVSGGHSNQY